MNSECLRLNELDTSDKFALIPVSGDCLERAGIYDGDFVEVAIGRYPRPPVYKSQAGYELQDVCLCYRLDHAAVTDNPPLMLKSYIGVFQGQHTVGTMYLKQKRAFDKAFPAHVLGVVYAVYSKDMLPRWKCPPEVFPPSLEGGEIVDMAI